MSLSFNKFVSILTTVAPVILLVVPGGTVLAPLLPLIIKAIADAERQAGASGPEKRAQVVATIQRVAAASNVMDPGTVNQVVMKAALGHAIDAMLTSVNAVAVAHEAVPSALGLTVPKP